jgi:hypothetical protein
MRIKDFEGDAFISYAHLDNVGLVEGRKGWVANLHRALEVRVAQLLGKEARIWWDAELQGNDVFAITLVDQLKRVAALIAVITPRYVRSDWGRRELSEFCKVAEEQGGLRVEDKARIFKVLKTPVPLDQQPPELQSLLGYEFFKVDPASGKVRELDQVFGPEAERDFWLKLDDLANDLCLLIKMLEPEPGPGARADPSRGTVYVALTTTELNDEREALVRDLEQHGYAVLPNRSLPLSAPEVEEHVRSDLSRCRMSIHLVGATCSLVPEGGDDPLQEIQNELALERAKQGSFVHLVWIAPHLNVSDERQRRFLERLRSDERCPKGTDLLETSFEDLRTVIDLRLQQQEKTSTATRTPPCAGAAMPQLYLLYDSRDSSAVTAWTDVLFPSFEVIHPVFEGSETDLREYHAENLRCCDAVLIFYGAGNELWLRGKLREIQKSPGYGRTKALPVVGIALIAPRTPEKERFRTHEALVIPQWDGPAADALQELANRVKQEQSPPTDATGTAV